MDKSCILLTLSIKTALFMEKSCILPTLSTKTAFLWITATAVAATQAFEAKTLRREPNGYFIIAATQVF